MKLVLMFMLAVMLHSSCSTSRIEVKGAMVLRSDADGTYFEFLDKSGGWFMEGQTDFKVGQVLKVTIDTNGTLEIEDDELRSIVDFLCLKPSLQSAGFNAHPAQPPRGVSG